MDKVDTKEIIAQYINSLPKHIGRKYKSVIDRDELYAYERDNDKTLFEMDVDDLTDYLMHYTTLHGKPKPINVASIPQTVAVYRQLFNYYIDHVEVIKNPWYDPRMCGMKLIDRMSELREPDDILTKEKLDRIIAEVRKAYNPYRADYIECIMLLYY